MKTVNTVWWLTPVISVLRRLTKEGHELKASLGYILFSKKNYIKPDLVAHNFNPRTQEAGVGGSLSLRLAC